MEQENDKKTGEVLVGAIGQIAGIMQSEQAVREVSTSLLIALGGAVLEIQVRLGMFDEARRLADAFGIGAAALKLHNEQLEEEE